MRIIGGALSGRKLKAKVRAGTRPTSDRVREALSAALEARNAVQDAHVLDLFSGTGALAFEMISRGAKSAVCIEWDKSTAHDLKRNAESLGIESQITVLKLDLLKPNPVPTIEKIREVQPHFNLVLVDPPYDQTDRAVAFIESLVACAVIDENGWIAIEHATRHSLPQLKQLSKVTEYKYGDTRVMLASPNTDTDTDTNIDIDSGVSS